MRRPLNTYRSISSRHGDRTGRGFFGKHLGTDYATAVGTPVYAPCPGTITSTAWSSSVGHTIELREDGSGRIHRLLHLNGDVVAVGQHVVEGQHIGYSGQTGTNITGPHLHWDVRAAGTTWNSSFTNYYDPEALVSSVPTSLGLAPGRYVFLKPHVSRWRLYPPHVKPKKGREIAYLNPKKFGGLTYQVLAVPFANTATIQTQLFGRGNIYIDQDAEIR